MRRSVFARLLNAVAAVHQPVHTRRRLPQRPNFEELEARITPFAPLVVNMPAGPFVVNDDQSQQFSPITGNAISVADPNPGASQDIVYIGAGNGSINVSYSPNLTGVARYGASLVGLIGSPAAINDALNGLYYIPAPLYHGPDLLSVSIDNPIFGLTATQSTPLSISQGNIRPTIDGPTTVEAGSGLLLFSPGNGNAITINDPDSAGGVETVNLSTWYGSLLPLNTAGLSYVTGGSTNDVTMYGTVAALNAALNGLAYQTPPGTTQDYLSISVNDNGHTGPVEQGAQLSINLNLDGAFDLAPTATGPGYQTFNGAGVTLSQANGNPIHLADGDANGNIETVYVQTVSGTLTVNTGGNPLTYGNGTSLLILSGTVATLNSELDGLHYTPHGASSDYLDVLVSDGFRSASQVNYLFFDSSTTLAPTISMPTAQDIPTGDYQTFTNGLIQIAAGDAGNNVQTLFVQVANGRIGVGNTAGLTSLQGNGTSLLQMTGTVAALNAALDGLSYAPDFNGDNDVLDIELISTGSGGPARATATGMQLIVFTPSYGC